MQADGRVAAAADSGTLSLIIGAMLCLPLPTFKQKKTVLKNVFFSVCLIIFILIERNCLPRRSYRAGHPELDAILEQDDGQVL
jgi:hypothetical protein